MALRPLLLIFSLSVMIHGSFGSTWCICRTDISDSSLQKTLDYACGSGADCSAILQSGACFQPNTVKAHCSYAANSYFQRKGQVSGACDFSGTAITTQSDPSTGGSCVYPSSTSTAGTTLGVNGSSGFTPSGLGISPSGTFDNSSKSLQTHCLISVVFSFFFIWYLTNLLC